MTCLQINIIDDILCCVYSVVDIQNLGPWQNSNKGPQKIDVAINNCNQTMLPSTMLQGWL